MNTIDLIAEAASLPMEERARVVGSLLQTLNPVDESTSAAWLAVARRRRDEIVSRRVDTIPGDAVFKKSVPSSWAMKFQFYILAVMHLRRAPGYRHERA